MSFKIEIEVHDWQRDKLVVFTRDLPSLKEVRKVVIMETWLICQAGIIPKKIFSAINHAVSVCEEKGCWLRFRGEDYWIKVGIDPHVYKGTE